VARELCALEPEQFTAARNQAVKAADDESAVAGIAAMCKPTLAA
jgi:hypothetical protein